MKTDYKVDDKVIILPFEVGTVGRRTYYPLMLQNIGLVGTVTMVHDNGVRVKTSVDTWSYDFKFIKPLEETSMTSYTKPTAINVINQSRKVRAKLSKALVSLGYDLDDDYGEGSDGNSTRIYNGYRNHDLGAVSERSSASTVDATDLKFKAVLKAVIPLLEFSTERPQVGDKVVVLDNPENLDDVHVGIVGTVQKDDHSPSLPLQVKLPNQEWWFSLDSVRVLKAAEKVETSSVAVKVPADPVFQPKFKVGDTVKVVAHDRTSLPMDKTYTVIVVEDIDYTGDLPYRVKSGGITDWVGHTALELVHEEPTELQQADFKFTRVKLKATGARGVVIGYGINAVCVQFDKRSDHLHSGHSMHGADKRCWYHAVEDLEIIGG